MPYAWINEFAGSITVCDPDGIILEMNRKAIETFQEDGGERLIGTNVLDCHPEKARARLEYLMANRQTNVYTIEKKGVKKLVYQAPWYQDGQYAGFVEMVVEIPVEMPHFVRG